MRPLDLKNRRRRGRSSLNPPPKIRRASYFFFRNFRFQTASYFSAHTIRLISFKEFSSSKCVLYLGASYFRAASYFWEGGLLYQIKDQIHEKRGLRV